MAACCRAPETGCKIRFFGVSINDYEPDNALKFIETGVVDSVQVIYNIFEQAPEERLFLAWNAKASGVTVRGVLDEGGLIRQIRADTVFPEGDFRENYFRGERKREVEERAGRIVEDLNIAPDALAETALRFALSTRRSPPSSRCAMSNAIVRSVMVLA